MDEGRRAAVRRRDGVAGDHLRDGTRVVERGGRIGQQLIGVAYAPVASASDQVALGRASSLVAALPSPAGSGQPAVTALATSPEALEPGVAGALFVVASPVVTVEVWSTTLANDKLAEQECP